jgi:hypothetical protein
VTAEELVKIIAGKRTEIERAWYGRNIPAAFECPCCNAVSHAPQNIVQGYCGRCHWWTGDPLLGPSHLESPCVARSLALDALRKADSVAVLDDDLGDWIQRGRE